MQSNSLGASGRYLRNRPLTTSSLKRSCCPTSPPTSLNKRKPFTITILNRYIKTFLYHLRFLLKAGYDESSWSFLFSQSILAISDVCIVERIWMAFLSIHFRHSMPVDVLLSSSFNISLFMKSRGIHFLLDRIVPQPFVLLPWSQWKRAGVVHQLFTYRRYPLFNTSANYIKLVMTLCEAGSSPLSWSV